MFFSVSSSSFFFHIIIFLWIILFDKYRATNATSYAYTLKVHHLKKYRNNKKHSLHFSFCYVTIEIRYSRIIYSYIHYNNRYNNLSRGRKFNVPSKKKKKRKIDRSSFFKFRAKSVSLLLKIKFDVGGKKIFSRMNLQSSWSVKNLKISWE